VVLKILIVFCVGLSIEVICVLRHFGSLIHVSEHKSSISEQCGCGFYSSDNVFRRMHAGHQNA
jgi:hypothetical protein